MGDGTSTATVPAHAMIAAGMRNIAAGASALEKAAARHAQQRDAHERIKRHHRDVMAQVSSLRKAVDKPL